MFGAIGKMTRAFVIMAWHEFLAGFVMTFLTDGYGQNVAKPSITQKFCGVIVKNDHCLKWPILEYVFSKKGPYCRCGSQLVDFLYEILSSLSNDNQSRNNNWIAPSVCILFLTCISILLLHKVICIAIFHRYNLYFQIATSLYPNPTLENDAWVIMFLTPHDWVCNKSVSIPMYLWGLLTPEAVCQMDKSYLWYQTDMI